MRKSLLALPLTLLAALPFWIGDAAGSAPSEGAARPAFEFASLPATPRPAALVDRRTPATPEPATRHGLLAPEEAPADVTTTETAAAAPLPLAHEPGRLPSGLLLDVNATEEALAAHYAGLPLDGLVRQVHRIDQLSARLETPPTDDPLLSARLREFAGETDALQHERAWLYRALNAYTNADDRGERVPTAVALETFIERHGEKDLEDLHVLQVQVTRRYMLLHKRAIVALFDAGKYATYTHDQDRGPIG